MEKLQSLSKWWMALFVVQIISNSAFSQINLVQNPSFETISRCPAGYGQIDTALEWSTFKNGGGGTPELFNACNLTIVGVPFNMGSWNQYAHSGISYAGIDVAYSVSVSREYIQSQLSDTLQAGKTYCVTFYANLPNVSTAFIEPLGVYLDNGSISTSTFGLAMVTPQVYNTGGQLSDTLNWMKVQGAFVAGGTESYINIGNFFDDANSNIGFMGSTSSWDAYYYIDDISVIDMSTPAYAGRDTLINTGDSVFVGRTPEIGLDEDCVWFVGGLPIDTVAGMWVKPTVNTTYVLEQNICGVVTYDTVKVSIVGAVGINEVSIKNEKLRIYPNPANSSITIALDIAPKENTLIEIQNVLGQIVFSETVYSKQSVIDLSAIPNGIYFVRMKVANASFSRKFVKK